MKRSTQCAALCLLTLIMTLAFGCGGGEPKKTERAVKHVVFIPNSASNFWKLAEKGCEKADAELANVTVTIKTPFGGTVKEQERFINESIQRDDTDAIAISPINPAEQQAALNNVAKRMLLITQDSDAPDSDRALYLGADNRAAGQQAGELVKKALPQGGKIMVFAGKREVQNAQERLEGLKAALAGSKVEVLDLMTDDTDQMKAKDNALEAMEKHPDLAGMVGLWSYNGPALVRAVQNANKVGKVKIVCFDDQKETLDAIKEGIIFGTVAQQPYEYGYQAVQLMAKILSGDKSVIPANKTVLIPTVIVQRDNLDAYRTKMDQMLAAN
jgi:ribose transport system substrate-binding protein